MDSNTYIFEEGGVRFFLLNGDEKSLLIDSGMMTKNAKDIVSDYTNKEILLINTHADMDHIGSNAQFDTCFMHPSECVNYKGKIKAVWDGDILDLGNRRIQIIHIPGHTPGSIALLDINRRILFSGDPIQKNGKVFMFGSMRNLQANILSMEKLEKMDSFDFIYPSHGEYPLEKECIAKIKDGCMKILDNSIEFEEIEMFKKKVKCFDIDVCSILMD